MRIALASVVAIVGTLFVASPAEAAQNCPSATFCMYDTSASSGPFEVREVADSSPGECHALSTGKASWIRNQTSRPWRVHTGSFCGGLSQTIAANSAAALNSNTNNRVWWYIKL